MFQNELPRALILILTTTAVVLARTNSNSTTELHTIGDTGAKMSLVMFVDFQDVEARTAWSTMKRLLFYYGEKNLYFTFRPLSTFNNRQSSYICFSTESISRNILPSEYWDVVDFFLSKSTEFSNELYENKTAIYLMDHLRDYASLFIPNSSLEIYDQDFASPSVFTTINNNIIAATSYGFYRSPSYLINGHPYPLPYNASFDQFVTLLESKNETLGIDLSTTSCKVYWGFMIIFMAITVGLSILLLVVCINSRFKSLRQDLFDPTKRWETVTVPETAHKRDSQSADNEQNIEDNEQQTNPPPGGDDNDDISTSNGEE